VLGDRSCLLQHIEPVPELLELRQDDLTPAVLLSSPALRVDRLLDVLPRGNHFRPSRCGMATGPSGPAARIFRPPQTSTAAPAPFPHQERCSTTGSPRSQTGGRQRDAVLVADAPYRHPVLMAILRAGHYAIMTLHLTTAGLTRIQHTPRTHSPVPMRSAFWSHMWPSGFAPEPGAICTPLRARSEVDRRTDLPKSGR